MVAFIFILMIALIGYLWFRLSGEGQKYQEERQRWENSKEKSDRLLKQKIEELDKANQHIQSLQDNADKQLRELEDELSEACTTFLGVLFTETEQFTKQELKARLKEINREVAPVFNLEYSNDGDSKQQLELYKQIVGKVHKLLKDSECIIQGNITRSLDNGELQEVPGVLIDSEHVENSINGEAAEEEAKKAFKAEIENEKDIDAYLLSSLDIPTKNGTSTQIDFVILNKKGAFLYDVKSSEYFSKYQYGDEDQQLYHKEALAFTLAEEASKETNRLAKGTTFRKNFATKLREATIHPAYIIVNGNNITFRSKDGVPVYSLEEAIKHFRNFSNNNDDKWESNLKLNAGHLEKYANGKYEKRFEYQLLSPFATDIIKRLQQFTESEKEN